MDDLLEKQAKFVLINLGYTPEASSALLEKSASNWAKVATIHPEEIKSTGTEFMTKSAGIWNEKVIPYKEKIDNMRVNLIKEAAEMVFVEADAKVLEPFIKIAEDKVKGAETVDSMLSLNFVNSENIGKFKGYSPLLQLAASKLCQLAIASRLGVTQIDERDAVRAFKSIDNLVSDLELM